MRKKVILITGASGEIGQALVKALAKQSEMPILSLDIAPVPEDLHTLVTAMQGDIMDKALLSRLVSEYELATIYPLAALLSARSEFTPEPPPSAPHLGLHSPGNTHLQYCSKATY